VEAMRHPWRKHDVLRAQRMPDYYCSG
jgi:hypothetical protein